MINIICVGKLKESYLENFVLDYKQRISKYHKINIIELKDNEKEEESKRIIEKINTKDYVILLDIEGEEVNSIEFAKVLDKAFLKSGTVDFIIGGSNGVNEEVKMRCNKLISFSHLTFPHGVFRGILLEQIYRAFKINNNETYHK